MSRSKYQRSWSRGLRCCLALCLPALLTPGVAGTFVFRDVSDTSLGLWEGEKPVFVYHHGVIRREGVPADRARSTYFHPVYGLDGEVLTDDFPADHYHHRGLFWAWPHVEVGGKEYDLWMLRGVEHRFEKWLAREATGEQAVLSLQNGWYVGPRRVLEERVTVTVHPADERARAVDLQFAWTPVDRAVTLAGAEGKSYGGLTLRFAPRTNTVITTPVGDDSEDLPMTRLAWADLTAQFVGAPGPSGAAILVKETHPDFPPMWLTRHYGVLCLGWPGVDPHTLAPGETARCEYRVWIHRGAATAEALRAAYREYNGQAPRDEAGKNMFFAFDNGVGRGQLSPREQARWLKELGYDGISYSGTGELDARLAAFEEAGLRIFALYVQGRVGESAGYDPGLPAAIDRLKGRNTVIWLTLQGDAGADEAAAVKLISDVADLARAAGLRVALYPHQGFYVATAEHALRLVQRANRKNLGFTINLCHELMAGAQEKLPAVVKAGAAKLFLVSVNGADEGRTVGETIQVLGQGQYDVLGFLRMLDRAGYGGPVGLQAYGVGGDARENLQTSMETWRRYVAERCRSGTDR